MNFIQRFLSAWRDASQPVRYEFRVSDADFWTQADADYMRGVFASNTGKKFQAKLTNYVYECAVDAARETANHDYHSGMARGADKTVTAIINNFARPARSQATLEEQPLPSGVAAFGFN